MSKVSKRRFCPAEHREITPVECGEGRGSRFACPADCAFNPLAPANYGDLLRLEEQVDKQGFQWLLRHAPDQGALERDLARAADDASSPHSLHALIVWRLYFEKDADGLTPAQRWEQAGFAGLKNDARVLMRAKMGIRIALIEVHRVLDGERTEVVDLLRAQPRPSIVMDRGLASSATRFATAVTWLYSLPHFDRLFGSAILMEEVEGFEPQEVVEEVVRHLGGPIKEAEMRCWLAGHFVRFNDALTAVGRERRRLMFAGMDAKFGKAVYELRAPFGECRDRLDRVPEVAEDDLDGEERREGFAEARAWFGDEGDAEGVPAGPVAAAVLGRVLMGQAHWRLEAIGGERLAALRRRFEAHMGERVRLTGERLDDLGMSMADKAPAAELSLVPPRLLEQPKVLHIGSSRVQLSPEGRSREEVEREILAAHDRAFLDTAIPMLHGRTPREAARDRKLRPLLLRLMKSRVRSTDERNLETGHNEDVNWMLRELGLEEILFDPPPPGRAPRTLEEPDLDDGEDADDFVFESLDEESAAPMNPGLPPAPPLPRGPFSVQEIEERMRALIEEEGEHDEGLLASVEADGCTLIDDIDEVTVGLVDDKGFALLVPILVNAWRVFVPRGTRGPNLSRAALRRAIHREAQDLMDALNRRESSALEAYIGSGPQPELSRAMMGMVVNGAEIMPRKARPSVEQQAVVGAVLRAVIAELDRAHRLL